jgi:hypothetical protein
MRKFLLVAIVLLAFLMVFNCTPPTTGEDTDPNAEQPTFAFIAKLSDGTKTSFGMYETGEGRGWNVLIDDAKTADTLTSIYVKHTLTSEGRRALANSVVYTAGSTIQNADNPTIAARTYWEGTTKKQYPSGEYTFLGIGMNSGGKVVAFDYKASTQKYSHIPE